MTYTGFMVPTVLFRLELTLAARQLCGRLRECDVIGDDVKPGSAEEDDVWARERGGETGLLCLFCF